MESGNSAGKANADQNTAVMHKPQTGTFATLGDKFSKLGGVIGIGPGGLIFEYAFTMEILDHPSWIDIFTTDGGFRLSRIPCRVVNDWPVQSAGDVHTRRCRIKFGVLGPEQEAALKEFIRMQSACGPG